MTDHLTGQTGELSDLLKVLSDQELKEQSLHYLIEAKKLQMKASEFGAYKFEVMRTAVKREQEYRAQRRT